MKIQQSFHQLQGLRCGRQSLKHKLQYKDHWLRFIIYASCMWMIKVAIAVCGACGLKLSLFLQFGSAENGDWFRQMLKVRMFWTMLFGKHMVITIFSTTKLGRRCKILEVVFYLQELHLLSKIRQSYKWFLFCYVTLTVSCLKIGIKANRL